MKRCSRRQHGFALVVVMGAIALLALIGTRITAAGRSELRVTANIREAAQAEAAADGAVHEAAFHLLDTSPQAWRADAKLRVLVSRGLRIEVQASDPAGKLNPNLAPPALMAALIRVVGGDPQRAGAIAEAIFDWRTPGQLSFSGGSKRAVYLAANADYGPAGRPFTDLDEMLAVRGMTPQLLAALRPHLSLVNFATIDLRLADPQVRRALQDAQIGQPGDTDVGRVVVVLARAVLPDGASFTRRAALLLSPNDDGRPFRILEWNSDDV